MDCLSCNKCDILGTHLWRYKCTKCRCANYLHTSYIQMRIEIINGSVNWVDQLVSKSISQMDDYKDAMENAASKDLLWLPIGLSDNTMSDFIDLFQEQLCLSKNKTNRFRIEKIIAYQIPMVDCSIVETTSNSNEVEGDIISQAEFNFKQSRDSNYLGFGEVEDVDLSETCMHCQQQYDLNDKFCVRITHSGTVSWHVSCFKCVKCQQELIDFHYCWNTVDSSIYCMRHFDDVSVNRCAGCDALIFEKDYTKAMSMDYHVEHFACVSCDLSLTGEKFVDKDGSPYCLKCYEIKFANVCDRCNERITCDGKELAYNDRHWHDTCFFCNQCQVSLVDQAFATKDQDLFCPTCYDDKFAVHCNGCNKPFVAGIKKFEYGGKQWHEECFLCSDCHESIGAKSFIPKNDKTLCVKCYEENYAQKCFKCKEVIRKGGVTYKSDPWHKECFVCVICHKELANTKFTSKDDKPYCAECFAETFSKRCKKCEKPISGFGGCKYISLDDDHWHTECFNCAKCHTNLVGKGFLTHNLEIMCQVCGQVESSTD